MTQLPQEITSVDQEHVEAAHSSSLHRHRRYHRPLYQSRFPFSAHVVTATGILYLLFNVVGIWWITFPLLRYLPDRLPMALLLFLLPIPIFSVSCLFFSVAFFRYVRWALHAMTYTCIALVLYGFFLLWSLYFSVATMVMIMANCFLLCLLVDYKMLDRFGHRRLHRGNKRAHS